MLVRALNRNRLDEFVGHLMAQARVVGPVQGREHVVFDALRAPEDLLVDYASTTIPPARLFLPAEEVLLEFDPRGQTFAPVTPRPEPTILFGAHSCDLHAIALLDEIMTEEPADAHYVARRRATTIIGWACAAPCDDEAFCLEKGTLRARTGYDLFGFAIDDYILWRARTAAGEALLSDAPGVRVATEGERARSREADRERRARFGRKLHGDVAKLPSALRRRRDDASLWVDDVGRRCISCGNCTMVCPTCYCFDVSDRIALDLISGERVRMWDSCQFRGFTALGGGDVFRETAGDREFHRVFKKEVYLLDRFGTSGCVGCGRCNRLCPAGISLINIYNAVLESLP